VKCPYCGAELGEIEVTEDPSDYYSSTIPIFIFYPKCGHDLWQED